MTEWLDRDRELSAERYRSTPMPDRVHHAWRYTDPKLFLPPGENVGSAGSFSLPSGRPPAGLILSDLNEAAEKMPDLVRPRLGAAGDSGKFDALNRATWRTGLFVHAAQGFDCPDPVLIALRPPKGDFGAFRVLVSAESRSRLALVLDLSGMDATRFAAINLAVEFFAGSEANLRYFLFQDLPSSCSFYLSQRAVLDRSAEFESVMASLGGGTMKADSAARLGAPGARSRFSGVIFIDGDRHFDHRTVHEHAARSTSGTFNYRAVLKDRARSVYTGLIRIENGAAGCEAYQENRNLMLSPSARADSIPELEILENDVDCSHGSATGPVEPDHLFYLMSRGLTETEAVRAIAEGFMDKVSAKLPPPLYARFKANVGRRLFDPKASA